MKFISLILAILMSFPALAQVAPEKIQNDTLKLGKSGSTANTNIEFKTSKLRENTSAGSVEVSHDGTNFGKIATEQYVDSSDAVKVTGPTGAVVDNTVPRYDGTTGYLIQGSGVVVSDTNVMTGLTGITSSGTITYSGIEVNSSNTAVTTNGDDVVISSATSSVYRLTGATLNSISGFNNTTAGRKIWIINNTGKQIIVKNDSASTANQGFLTGVGKDIKIKDKGSIEAMYNATMARWVIIGGTGSGGGASSEGVNILENPSFEDGLIGWSNSGGTLTQQAFTNPSEFEESYARFVSTANGQYFESSAKALPDFITGQCLAYAGSYKTTSGTAWKIQIISGTSTVLADSVLPVATWGISPRLAIPCPAVGTNLKIRFLASSASTIEVGKAYLGEEFRATDALFHDVGYALRAGQIITGAFATCPENTLEANGSAVSRTTYAQLFASIGITHGQGNGTSTFNLPDYRGRFLRGHANGSSNDPDSASRTAMATGGAVGDNVGSLQSDSFQGHRHDVSILNGVGFAGGGYTNPLVGFPASGIQSTGDPRTDTVNGTPRTSTETRPKNAYVKYCIQTVNTDITGTFRQIDEFESRLTNLGLVSNSKSAGNNNVRIEACGIGMSGSFSGDHCSNFVQSVSVSGTNGSVYNITFKSGLFSKEPTCLATVGWVSVGRRFATIKAVNTSSLQIVTQDGSVDYSSPFGIMCLGER